MMLYIIAKFNILIAASPTLHLHLYELLLILNFTPSMQCKPMCRRGLVYVIMAVNLQLHFTVS